MLVAAKSVTAVAGTFLLTATVAGPAAQADTPIESFATIPSTTQAGGHPDLDISFAVANRATQHSQSACNCEDAKDATVHFPAGFIGNPHATPQCTLADFTTDTCAVDSQVGIAYVATSYTEGVTFDSAVYNLVPPPDQAGLIAFKIVGYDTPQFIVLSARTGSDYGLDAKATSITHSQVPLASIQEVLWGDPAAKSHDPFRLAPGGGLGGGTAYYGRLCNASFEPSTDNPDTVIQPCGLIEQKLGLGSVSSNSPETPFLQNPTSCASALASSLEILSYDGGETSADSPWPQMTGCDQLSFNPSLFAQPTTTATDSPSGIDVDLEVPQQLSPSVPSPSELRAAKVILPEGFSINPGAADGKTACADAEAHLGPFATEEESQCPEDSKIGSLTIESSALPGPLPGFVYLGQPEPGNRYRIFLVANGFATHIKLAGTARPDPQTGQLTIDFPELPQTPLTAFNMHFFGSERGILATPTQCGTFPVTSTFTPWDESLSAQTSTQYFTLKSGPGGSECPGATRPFRPTFQAVSSGHTPAAHTPFSLEVTRPDGDQDLSGLTVTTPPGFLATLKGIPYCSDPGLSQAAEPTYSGLEEEINPSCPAASQVGTSVAGAGAGTHPVYLPGKVYLAGPYKGAPLSLAVITPAVTGPYDVGNVVVRAALHVNSETAQITAVSDPPPQIHEGIPLRLREFRIELNRPNFTLDPTNCDPFTVNAEISGNQGSVAHLAEHYQMADCGTLPFAPKLAIRISGPTQRIGNPALTATLTAGPGEANVARTAVTLPHSEFLDNAHIRSPCLRSQFAAEKCPSGSLLGYAKAETPLLEKPLEGPVYLRANGGERKLPDLVAQLKGQIDINLIGFVSSENGQLRTTFASVPDAPVSKFTLSLDGGSKSLLQNSINLCSVTEHVGVKMTGQNGRTISQSPALQTPCRGKSSKRKHTSPSRAKLSNRGGRH